MGRFRDVQEFVRLSRELATLKELHRSIETVARTFGIRYFLLSHHVNVSSPHIVQLSNYPEAWGTRMRTKAHFRVEPVIQACQKTAAPFLWAELGSLIKISAIQRDILEGAEKVGIGPGFTVPIHIPGECTGSGSFAVRTGETLDLSALPALQYLACFAFEAARRMSLGVNRKMNLSAAETRKFTERQLDCIVLIAQGKSDWDVGQILGISQRTVQEHLETARRRYGVSTRMQLVVRTLFDNQLGFEDILRA